MQHKPNKHYRWINRSNGRFFEAWLTKDLLDDWVVTRINGGLCQKTGRVKHVVCSSKKEGLQLIATIEKARKRKGYV